jgi:hypothetical protein
MTRKAFFVAATAAATIFVSNQQAWSADALADIKEQIAKQHDQTVKRLQDWIHQVSIAAENRGYPEGADYMIKLLQEAGFDQVRQVPTEGKPGVFARCRGPENCRHLFHVRREIVRSGGMDFATDRRSAGR